MTTDTPDMPDMPTFVAFHPGGISGIGQPSLEFRLPGGVRVEVWYYANDWMVFAFVHPGDPYNQINEVEDDEVEEAYCDPEVFKVEIHDEEKAAVIQLAETLSIAISGVKP